MRMPLATRPCERTPSCKGRWKLIMKRRLRPPLSLIRLRWARWAEGRQRGAIMGFYRFTTPVARKRHKCYACGKIIEAGERCCYYVGKEDGDDFYTYYLHNACDDRVRAMCATCPYPGDCFDLHQCFCKYYKETTTTTPSRTEKQE